MLVHMTNMMYIYIYMWNIVKHFPEKIKLSKSLTMFDPWQFSCQVRWMEISSWPKSSCGRSVRRTTSPGVARGNPHPHHRCPRWRLNPSLSPQRSQRQGWGLDPIWSNVSNLHSHFWAQNGWRNLFWNRPHCHTTSLLVWRDLQTPMFGIPFRSSKRVLDGTCEFGGQLCKSDNW